MHQLTKISDVPWKAYKIRQGAMCGMKSVCRKVSLLFSFILLTHSKQDDIAWRWTPGNSKQKTNSTISVFTKCTRTRSFVVKPHGCVFVPLFLKPGGQDVGASADVPGDLNCHGDMGGTVFEASALIWWVKTSTSLSVMKLTCFPWEFEGTTSGKEQLGCRCYSEGSCLVDHMKQRTGKDGNDSETSSHVVRPDVVMLLQCTILFMVSAVI